MSLIIFASIAALVSGAAGAIFARRRLANAEPETPALPPAPAPPKPEGPKLPSGIPVALGDVVSAEVEDRASGGIAKKFEERWLAGGLVAMEGTSFVGAVFLAPEGTKLEAIAVFAPPRSEIAWMTPIEIEMTSEPPSRLEVGKSVLDRKSRLPVKIIRVGQGAPRVDERATWAEYGVSTGPDVAVVLAFGATALAWRGLRLEKGEFDRMGSGELEKS